jgi:FkbM family methyltransferase
MMARSWLEAARLGVPYRLAADVLASTVCQFPMLERPFVGITRAMWSWPGVGRFCRSSAYRLADRLRHSGASYRDVVVAGVRLHVDVSHWTMSGVYFARVDYEPATTRFLARHLKAGGVFVDVGANSGYFSLLAAHYVGPSGLVFAFEPNPPVFDELTQHVTVNGLSSRVETGMCALSDTSAASAPLFVSPSHSGFSSLVIDGAPGADRFSEGLTVHVPTQRFDDWLDGRTLERIDLMKIDVEGAEGQVVAGMAGALRDRRIARIICETAWGSAAHEVLVGHGYHPDVIESVGPVSNIAYILDS